MSTVEDRTKGSVQAAPASVDAAVMPRLSPVARAGFMTIV